MELGLNLLWALISALTLAFWARAARSQRFQRGALVRSAATLICLLILLFPVISITDDLHATEFVEASTSGGRKARAGAPSDALDGTIAAIATVSLLLEPPAATVESLFSILPTQSLAGAVLSPASRAPPRPSTSL